MIYLASPYAHKDKTVMEDRFDKVCRVAGQMMKYGEVVYSPIAHNHPIAVRIELPRTWDFWKTFDEHMILRCACVKVLMLDGWKESVGITAEIQIAKLASMNVEYIDPKYFIDIL